MSAVEHWNGKEIDYRQVHIDHADEQDELPEIFTGNLVGHIRDRQRPAHRKGRDTSKNHRIKIQINGPDRANRAMATHFQGFEYRVRLVQPGIELEP